MDNIVIFIPYIKTRYVDILNVVYMNAQKSDVNLTSIKFTMLCSQVLA